MFLQFVTEKLSCAAYVREKPFADLEAAPLTLAQLKSNVKSKSTDIHKLKNILDKRDKELLKLYPNQTFPYIYISRFNVPLKVLSVVYKFNASLGRYDAFPVKSFEQIPFSSSALYGPGSSYKNKFRVILAHDSNSSTEVEVEPFSFQNSILTSTYPVKDYIARPFIGRI